jgi:hypothetical protein
MPGTSNDDKSVLNRGTSHEVGPSNAPQEESNRWKMPGTSNEDRSLPNRGTNQEAGPSNAPQEESNRWKMPGTSNDDKSVPNRGTSQEAGPSNAAQEERNRWKMALTSNEDRFLQYWSTIQQAGPSSAPQQEVSTSEDGDAARPFSQFMPHEVCDLDQEVLAALPEDIRQEVLQAYQARSSSQVKRDEVVTSVKSPTINQVLKYVMVTMSMSCLLIL